MKLEIFRRDMQSAISTQTSKSNFGQWDHGVYSDMSPKLILFSVIRHWVTDIPHILCTDIISTPALALLCEAGIETTFAQEVPHIINRDKTGWCPLETACMELNTVEEMYPVIQNFISRIRAK